MIIVVIYNCNAITSNIDIKGHNCSDITGDNGIKNDNCSDW